MKTTLREIWNHDPCCKNDDSGGWGLLTKNLGTDDLDTEVSLIQILESNGLDDAIWSLRCFDYVDYCLFLADVAELVLPIFEKEFPNDKQPRKAIQAIRDFKAGKISKSELLAATYAAARATYAAARAAADAAYAAADAAYAAARAARAADAAYAAADAAADAADAAARAARAEIEKLFIKHFGE